MTAPFEGVQCSHKRYDNSAKRIDVNTSMSEVRAIGIGTMFTKLDFDGQASDHSSESSSVWFPNDPSS